MPEGGFGYLVLGEAFQRCGKVALFPNTNLMNAKIVPRQFPHLVSFFKRMAWSATTPIPVPLRADAELVGRPAAREIEDLTGSKRT